MAVRTMLSRDIRCVNGDSEENIFSGFLFCGDCGQPMVRSIVPSGKKKYYYYVCSSHRRKEGCSTHSISACMLEDVVTAALRMQIENILDMADILSYIDRLPAEQGMIFDYESQIASIEKEVEHYRKMKLRLYEDLTEGIIDKREYTDFRNQYTASLDEKMETLERVRRESKEVRTAGETGKLWVRLFKQYEGFGELTRRILMSMVDRILIYEDHAVEVVFRYKDEFERVSEFVDAHADILPAGILPSVKDQEVA